jgi:hypothetical protein
VATDVGQQNESRAVADAEQLALEPLARLRSAHHAMALLARVWPLTLIAIAGVVQLVLYQPRAEAVLVEW